MTFTIKKEGSCCFEHYDREKGEMVQCGKPGRIFTRGGHLCTDCAKESAMLMRGATYKIGGREVLRDEFLREAGQ